MCSEAIGKVHTFESWLVENVVTKEANFLPRLEKCLLDLAASPGVAAGVHYHLAFEKGGEKVVRYFESGQYDGAMENLFMSDLGDQNIYRIFSKEDVEKRSQDITKRTENISKSRKKGETSRVRNRGGERYKDLMTGNDNCVKSLLQKLILQLEIACVSVKSLVVSVLRKEASSAKENDRYLYVVGHSEENVSNILNDHTVNGRRSQVVDVNVRKEQLSIAEQFELLSNVPNLHWNKKHVQFMQTLSVQACEKYLPMSPRNRYIHFVVLGQLDEARNALLRPGEKATTERTNSTSAKRRKKNPPLSQKTTAELLDDIGEMQAPDVSSMSQSLTLYKDFVRLLIESGCLSWRSVGPEQYVVVMNSYSPKSGEFSPSEFVHVQFSNVKSQCTCSSFKDMTDDSKTCMHVRFVEEEILPRLSYLFNESWLPTTPLQELLHSKIDDHLSPVSLVGQCDIEKTLKFSVKGMSSSMGFVHISENGKYIACQSGSCVRVMNHKRSVQKFRELNQVESLCPHLETMHASHEIWEAFLTPTGEKTKLDQGHHYFEKESGEWNFGGLTMHQPKPEDSPQLKS